MKKVKILLPVVAVMVAVAGVFATGNTVTQLTVTASPGVSACGVDGICDDATFNGACKITSTNLQFYDISGSCLTAATGKFRQP